MIIFGNALPALFCLLLSASPLTNEPTPQRYHHEDGLPHREQRPALRQGASTVTRAVM
jgi:hypothetical protein